MTERVSHEEARLAVFETRPANTELLQAYITQQQALEADTVSRAEHEAALERADGHWLNEIGKMQDKLTALQAELATERARAEEAESDHRRVTQAFSEAATELAAANARAERLEEALKCEQVDHNETQGELAAAREDGRQVAALLESLVESGRAHPHHRTMEAMRRLLPTAPQASTEQASPSPAVGENEDPWEAASDAMAMEAEVATEELRPAQPAPSGTERWVPKVGDRVVSSLGTGVGTVRDVRLNSQIAYVVWDNGGTDLSCSEHWATLSTANPTPAEPQGRPEQAGEYVTVARLVEALRQVEEANPKRWFDALADRLEGK